MFRFIKRLLTKEVVTDFEWVKSLHRPNYWAAKITTNKAVYHGEINQYHNAETGKSTGFNSILYRRWQKEKFLADNNIEESK